MSDHREVDCDLVREALSARIDGERGPVSAARVHAHLSACPPCRAWHDHAVDQAERLRDLAAAARLRPPRVADSANRGARERLRQLASQVGWTWARWALGLVGALGVMMTVVQALTPGARGDMTAAHLLGESVAWSAAIGMGMIVAAVRPSAAAGLAGVLVAYSALLAVYVVGDATKGAITLLREVTHLPVVVGAVLALLVWRGARAPRPSPRGTASQPPNADVDMHDSASAPPRAHRRPRDGFAA